MRKILTAFAAAASIATAAVATSGAAEAQWGGHRVWDGDWRSGVVLGGFGYPYGYHGAYYGYEYPYRGPACRRRDVWNGYGWVPACS